MINPSIKRILAMALMLALLLSGCAALAEQVYVNGSVTVYAAPKTSAKKLGTLKAGASVTLTAEQSGWALIEKSGAKGYVKASALTKVEDCGNATAYTTASTALYKTFTGKTKLTTIPSGKAVTLVAKAGNRAYVKYGSKKGFVKAANLTTTAPQKAETTTAYVNKDGAKVYNSKGKATGTLALNTAVTVTATKDDICQITLNGATGYIKKADLSCDKVVQETPKADNTLKVGDTGDAVKKLQERLKALGYFTGTVGGNYQALTQSAVAAFQTVAKLTVTGTADEATLKALFSSSAPKKPTEDNAATSTGPVGDSTVAPATGTAIEMDWWTSGIQDIFARGVTAKITDVETGLAWREQRRGGTNHADVQPLTAADTAALKKAYGGTWSWNRRAIFVTINGINYAASMNGMPHGGGSITDNNFDGHHCIHFTNSRTHGSNKVCPLHQAAIKKALAAHM